MYKPQCENPILLFNKYCLTLLNNGCSLYFDNNRLPYNDSVQVNTFDLLQRARLMTNGQLDGCYCQAPGYREPLFLYVPCGNCDLCRHSRQVDIINRTILETATWDCPPYFFTLTYDEEHLPCLPGYPSLCRGELRYKDVQDFFKRLRIRWTRKGLNHDIRYLVAGEYGSKYGRPHYHVLLFNNPYGADELHPVKHDELRDDIFQSWSRCQPQSFDFGQCKGGAAPYATKYVLKPQATHGHMVKPFIRMSSGSRGGLGSIFLEQFKQYLRENPSLNYLEFCDKKGNYQYIYLSKFLNKKVWPSPSSSVPSRLRNAYRQLLDIIQYLHEIRALSLADAKVYAEELRPSPFLRNDIHKVPIHPLCHLSKLFHYNLAVKALDPLFDILQEEFYDGAYLCQYYMHRDSFIEQPTPDYAQKLSKIRQNFARQLDVAKF